MTSASSNDDDPLPFGSSHWDKLPTEIKDMVLMRISPLTRFLNGRLKPDIIMDHETILSIWLEAFDFDWQGDLNLLPNLPYNSRLTSVKITRIKSRSMYERMCKHFPGAAETIAKFGDSDEEINAIVQGDRILHGNLTVYHNGEQFRLLHVPMRHMWLDVLGDTLDKYPYARANDCILQGYTDLLRHLVDTGRVDLKCIKKVCVDSYGYRPPGILDVPSGRGHLDILKMLHEAGYHTASTMAMDQAAKNGHLDVVKWLHENRTEGCTTKAMDEAARDKHLDVVKFLHENRTEGCTTKAMDRAAARGHLDVVKFLHENRTEGCTIDAMNWAACCGHLDVVKFLHENRTEGCTHHAMNWAASCGRLDVVKWLHENRTEGCTHHAMDLAIAYGHLDVVKWLHENRPRDVGSDGMH